jgi:hypothetical protein
MEEFAKPSIRRRSKPLFFFGLLRTLDSVIPHKEHWFCLDAVIRLNFANCLIFAAPLLS